MIKITLPDGTQKEFENGSTPMDVAKSISEGLARNVISAKFNDITVETVTPLNEDGSLVLFTWNDTAGKKAFWHSSSHIVAQALEELYPGIKLTIGPAIENGFYYDFARDKPFSDTDFGKIEKEMRKIIERNSAFEREVWKRDEAIKYFKDKGIDVDVEFSWGATEGKVVARCVCDW